MFPPLPDTARLWVFSADRALADDERATLLRDVGAFLSTWTSHGRPVLAAAEFAEDRFLLVAAHIEEGVNAGVSGCGIDAMMAAVDAAAASLDFAWLDGLHVLFRSTDGQVQALPRSTFRQEARAGRVTGETIVIDTTVAELGALRAAGLERPAADCWHARVFRLHNHAAATS